MDATHRPASAPQPSGGASREPWRRRVMRRLLYGRDVDRAAKARARIGLVILVFALGYAVIATRLVMFATLPEGDRPRRALAQDVMAAARPRTLDPHSRSR